MKTKVLRLILAMLLCSALATQLSAQNDVVTYQGRVMNNGAAANGLYDLRFELFDTETNGLSVGVFTNVATPVDQGFFSVQMNFGAEVFDGTDRWLEIGARTNGGSAFSTLAPRQPITSTPYAIKALEASTVPMGAVMSDMLADGAVTSTKLAPGAATQLGTPDGSDPAVIQVSNEGLLGIGTDNPQAGLDVRAGRNVRTAELVFEAANGTGSFTNLSGIQSVAVSGDLLAIASSGSSAVTLFDVSNPASPVFKSQLRDGINGFDRLGGVRRIALSGELLVISARPENAVTLVDVSDPTNPTKLAELVDGQPGWTNLGGAMGVAVSGNLLAITAEFDDVVTLADISNPASPANLGEIVNGQAGFTNLNGPVSALISGNRLYIGAWAEDAVVIADINDPASPTLLASMRNGFDGYTGLDGADGLAISGNVLAIAGNQSDRVTLVDVSQPASPVKLAEFQNGETPGGEGAEVPVFFQSLLAVTDRAESTVTLYDLTIPTLPLVALRFENGSEGISLLGGAYGLVATTDNLFVGGNQSLLVLGIGTGEEMASFVTSGRAGIGTTDPQAALHVVGGAIIEGDAAIKGHLTARTLSGSQVFADSGFAGAPGYSFTGDANSGMYQPADDTVAISTAGRESLRIDSNGNVGIGTTSPSVPLHLNTPFDVDCSLRMVAGSSWSLIMNHSPSSVFSIQNGGQQRFFLLSNGRVGIGISNPSERLHVAGNILASGTIVGSSDRNVKENLAPVDTMEALEKVVAMPIHRWNYIGEKTPHMGPVAQDFHAAFGVGMDDKHISMVDADGVALAAIQGLNQKLEAARTENAELKTRLEKLEQLVNSLPR